MDAFFSNSLPLRNIPGLTQVATLITSQVTSLKPAALELCGVAERAGVEPAVPFWGTYDFQSYTFGHSVTSPCVLKNVACLAHAMHQMLSTSWPQVRVAHVAAAGALPALPLRGPSLLLRPFLAPGPGARKRPLGHLSGRT